MRISTILLAVVVASQMGNTDCGQVIRDSGFDLWCGDQLCAWKTERGAVKRVATWNEGDPGVELVGNDVAIEQLTPVDSGDGTCIEFSLVANVDRNTDLELNVDVLGDGTIDHKERLPEARWKLLTYDILIKAPYRGIRFELAKTGDGTAQLANIGAKIVRVEDGGCAGLAAIDPGPAPLGSFCDPSAMDATCASGLCQYVSDPNSFFGVSGACGQCDDTHPCDASQVCGLHEPTSPVRVASDGCVAPGSKELGERCLGNGECASNICNANGHCSACDAGTCSTCAAAWTNGPSVCSPGAHQGASGAPCTSDDDCATGSCQGTVRGECSDGRPCASAIDCPFGTGSDAPLQNGACTTVGIQGGSCR
jgi:hypothetical protein